MVQATEILSETLVKFTIYTQCDTKKVLSVNKAQATSKTYTFDIQDDSEGKVNILEGDSVGHCDKTSYDHMYNSEWLPR